MKFQLSIVALAAIGTLASAQATEISAELKKMAPQKTQTQTTAKAGNADFGVYQLALVPSSLADGQLEGTLSGRSLVKQTVVTPDSTLKANAVVKNLLTGELGVVTGRLSILAKDKAALQTLQQQFGLSLVKAMGQKVAILQAPAGLVQEARLDVTEKLYKPN
jgi:Open reading frame 2 N-terminal domain